MTRPLARAALAVLLVAPVAACSAPPSVRVESGEYGRARVRLAEAAPTRRGDENFLLARLSIGILELADGLPASAEGVMNETFDVLRTQGLNADRTLATFVAGEGARYWKGEPFEQALAYHYVALQKAMLGDWENMRAAAGSSLFLLKDFGRGESGSQLTKEQLARRAAARAEAGRDDYLDNGYQPVRTNFALGYLMNALANQAMGRAEEASDNYRRALEADPGLKALVDRLASGSFNTVLVVDAGRAPRKVQSGPYGSIASFVPLWRSDRQGISAWVEGGEHATWPIVCDVNAMAHDHRWNGLEDVRTAKAIFATALMGTGAALMADGGGRRSRNDGQQTAGAILFGVGVYMAMTSGADTRQCEYLPQRVYLVPLTVTRPGSTIRLQAGTLGAMVLPGVNPPRPEEPFQVRFVRLNYGPEVPPWALSGRVLYGNDEYAGRVPGDELPFILGGRDVSRPSRETLSRYQAAGYLTDFTVIDLENLYREEGIAIDLADERFRAGRHILEGGDSLACPLAGTAGFVRLFCREHPPYRPKSRRVRELAEQISRYRVQSGLTGF